MKKSFAPLSHSRCTTLILGSLPGELSLEKGQYYAHPRNAFWKIMCEILGEEFSEDYNARCDMLLRNNIALWDVIASAEREGSLDSDIRSALVNDFDTFLKEHPHITKILINGGKAKSLWNKHCKEISLPVIALPSTSPANARMSYAEKLSTWQKALLL